jgi:hypothetical protein
MKTLETITNTPCIRLSQIDHNGQVYIGLFFDFEASLIERIKTLPGRKYSRSKKCWYLPYSEESYSAFKLDFSLLG